MSGQAPTCDSILRAVYWDCVPDHLEIRADFWMQPKFQAMWWKSQWVYRCPPMPPTWRGRTGKMLTVWKRRSQFKKRKADFYSFAIERQGGEFCIACKSTCWLHLDHILPLVWGGLNIRENCQIMCQYCNSKKGGQIPFPPFDWRELTLSTLGFEQAKKQGITLCISGENFNG